MYFFLSLENLVFVFNKFKLIIIWVNVFKNYVYKDIYVYYRNKNCFFVFI